MGSRTNDIARHLLDANEDRLAELTPRMIDVIAEELGMPPLAPDHQWPADIIGATREFLVCVATDDHARIARRGGIFEHVGLESARGGLEFDELERSLRMATRLVQGQTHRAVLTDPTGFDQEAVLELMSRVLTAGEAVVVAARRGYDIAALAHGDEEELGRRLASELLSRGDRALDLAIALGWDPHGLVSAVITSPAGATQVASRTAVRPAWFTRAHDVVLAVPLPPDRLATSLRDVLGGTDCVVGPAVPILDFTESLALGHRLTGLSSDGLGGPALLGGPSFVDDSLLELACAADPMVVRALRRKYFADLDAQPEGSRSSLVATLHQWLLQWGHRPRIAAALAVHPQTVSGRLHRLRDLLADDLESPQVRAELLVLLAAERVA